MADSTRRAAGVIIGFNAVITCGRRHLNWRFRLCIAAADSEDDAAINFELSVIVLADGHGNLPGLAVEWHVIRKVNSAHRVEAADGRWQDVFVVHIAFAANRCTVRISARTWIVAQVRRAHVGFGMENTAVEIARFPGQRRKCVVEWGMEAIREFKRVFRRIDERQAIHLINQGRTRAKGRRSC